MTAQGHLRDAIIAELKRQSANAPKDLKVKIGTDNKVAINGTVDMDALAMAATGALAGGP